MTVEYYWPRRTEISKLCIYHGNCADGFTGAWVVRKALGQNVDFVGGVYQTPPPDVTGKDVILVDFSYKRPVMEQIVSQAKSVLVLDHHKTAEEDLTGLSGAEVVFDMNRAGSHIAWDYYFPKEIPPPVLMHVEDRDLWRFTMPDTREIQANIFSYPYDFAIWDRLMASDPKVLAVEGKAIERKHFKDIEELLGVVQRRMNIGGYNVPIANLPYTLVSDAAHKMAEGEPFAGCYWDTPKGRVFGLRSTDEGIDVSEIAKMYGGGGHRNAAGFSVPFDIAINFEVKKEIPTWPDVRKGVTND
jgi:oligoribonuclease NrnB/cAMP/cGMP phosphodiesterase (DHH superfamily)